MQCLFCKADNDKVVNSRASTDGLSVKRRRECLECGRRFTTYERVEKRPVSTEALENVVSEIERVIYDKFEREVETKIIGELIMRKLAILDKVAYVRFASVYREFKDIDEFLNELKPLVSVTKKAKNGSKEKKEE